MTTNPRPYDIGGVVRQKREALGLTRAKLAELCGVTRQNIHALERTPGRSVDLVTAGALAKALGCTADDLLSPREPKRAKSRTA